MMMMRKRTRSVEKNHLTAYDVGSESCLPSNVLGNSQKPNIFFNIPGLFVGMSPKGLPDSDSVRSPTSPLDFRVLSNLCNSPRSSRSPRDRRNTIWDKSKVGLSIVDCLSDDSGANGNAIKSSESKNILFGSRMRIMNMTSSSSFQAPKSLPNNFPTFPHTLVKSRLRGGNNADVVFEITDTPSGSECVGKAISCSLDSGRSFVAFSGFPTRNPNFGSYNSRLVNKSLNSTPSEIELSEDYTCVTSHGSNPKTTHIYGDCILGRHTNPATDLVKLPPIVKSTEIVSPNFPNDFLSFCYSCNEKLEDGKDIYIYRGEKAFCSPECRSREILIDEEKEKTIEETSSKPPEPEKGEELLETGIFIVT